MRDKNDISHSENALGGVNSGGSGKRKSCMRHCAKFWWAYLIGFIAAVVLIVCLIIFVAVPKIAQKKLDHAELVVDGITVSNTTPDTYTMSINSTLKSDGQVKATIAPFSGVMYLEDLEPHTPFVTINFPETKSVKLQTVNISQPIKIEDMAAFTTFNTWFQNNETVRVTIKGDTNIQVSGISRKYDVTFKNTVTLKGTCRVYPKISTAHTDIVKVSMVSRVSTSLTTQFPSPLMNGATTSRVMCQFPTTLSSPSRLAILLSQICSTATISVPSLSTTLSCTQASIMSACMPIFLRLPFWLPWLPGPLARTASSPSRSVARTLRAEAKGCHILPTPWLLVPSSLRLILARH
nr:uncharacterized protein CTRU02_04474 [Colletotrichum truncatum]KAF6795664.1 hypothetical protein CTRU02_04474 [Colletotrichum truncatum]